MNHVEEKIAAWRCKGRPAMEASFFPPEKADPPFFWSFSADLCAESWEPRIRKLMMGRTFPVGRSVAQDQPRSRMIARNELEPVAKGTAIGSVLSTLGTPTDAECHAQGFNITYAVAKGNSYREWDLTFDAQQRFVSARQTSGD
jgi:hypothetical protein